MTELRCGANRIDVIDGEPIVVHEPEHADPRDWLFHEGKIATFRPIFKEGVIDWREHVTFRVQGYNSCVGFDLSQKVELASKLQGHPLDFTSPLFNYTNARLLGEKTLIRKPGDPFLQDWGCGCRFAMMAARDNGLVVEGLWPESPETINRVPPAHLFKEGAVATLEAFYRIPSGKFAKEHKLPLPSVQIVEAMRRGYPPGGCMIVNQGYGQLGTKTWTGPIDDGSPSGGHAQTFAVWDPSERRFGVISTWGKHLGDEGIFWISADAVDEFFYDIWVVQHAPAEI